MIASDAKPIRRLSADSGGLSSPTDINGDDDDGLASFNPFDVEYNPPQQQKNRKLSKKIGGPSDPPIPVPSPLDGTRDGIEGAYMYTNKCNNVFQVNIDCGRFGDDDPDLCLYSEFSRGTLVETPEQGSEPLPGKGLYFLPNAAIPEDGIIDPDIVCEFSGTFRRSSSMVEEEDGYNQLKLEAIPLASSNGCETTTTNFKLVVKGTMKKADDDDATILELDFSDNFGFTYYTDTKVCPHSYIGQKLDEAEGDVQRALALNGSEDKHVSNSFVVRRQLFLSKFLRKKWGSFWRKICRSRCGPSPSTPTKSPTKAFATCQDTCGKCSGCLKPSCDCNNDDYEQGSCERLGVGFVWCG